MSLWEKIYFISAWVVAGCLGLALILYAVALRNNGLLAFATVCDAIFMGITGCFTLLYLSKWFRHSLVLFIMAWVVAGLALLALILSAAAGQGGTYTVGTLFWHIGFGGFCTLLLLHLSDWFTKAKSG